MVDEAEPSSVSSRLAIELPIIGGPIKGHRSLGADRAAAATDRLGGAMGAAAKAEPPSVSSSPAMELRVQSTVAVEHDCGATMESFLENGDNRIKLEASGQENTIVGQLG
jgi:hypothetical protein